jgi:ABC-type branched-subunit amino acid transport system substrate-binding protein
MSSVVVAPPKRHRSFRALAVGAACLVLAVGCGNRNKNADGGDLGGQSTTTAAGGSSGKFGTLDTPCGPGDAKGATDVGVTDTTIKVGVISDKDAGAVRVPTAGIEPTMKTFVEYCNGLGGINGRKLELKTYDAKLFSGLAAIKQACDDKLFAIVGMGVVQDAPMAQPMIDCGLVAVAAYTATYSMSLSPNVVAPVPNPGNEYATNALKWVADKYPDAIKKAAIFYPQIQASKAQGERTVQAAEPLGYDFIYTGTYPVVQTDWKTQVQTLKNKGVEYVTIVDSASGAIAMMQAMHDADYHPKVIYLGQQYYDPTVAESGVADGALVQTNTQPFETPNDAVTEYVDLLKKTDSTALPTTLGVQGFSAGLLFATAAKSLGSNLTRKGLLDELHGIHTWNGGGLHPDQDPGADKVNTCMKILTVKDSKFTNLEPDNDSTDPSESFVCDPSQVVKVTGNWGAVPKAK